MVSLFNLNKASAGLFCEQDCYSTLNVNHLATDREIVLAFRQKYKVARNNFLKASEADAPVLGEVLKDLQQAKYILTNPKIRKLYDFWTTSPMEAMSLLRGEKYIYPAQLSWVAILFVVIAVNYFWFYSTVVPETDKFVSDMKNTEGVHVAMIESLKRKMGSKLPKLTDEEYMATLTLQITEKLPFPIELYSENPNPNLHETDAEYIHWNKKKANVLTVKEYNELSSTDKITYKAFRHFENRRQNSSTQS